ncbi:MFS transporter, SP family, sugar:H+ symporter [Fonsecaea pedrosoi]|nr:MFS transporter, SP family, sugar:H+ symporter [Fonsecaea pedrosoi]
MTSEIMDRWGRKAAAAFCVVTSLIGGAGLTGSVNTTMFIIFRLIAGGGAWGFLTLIPVYVAELAPPKLRGFFVGLIGVFINVGYSIATYMGLAFYYVENNPGAQWRGPLGLALIFPAIHMLVVLWAPESPRYLLMKGQVEDAKRIVMDIHKVPNDPDQEYARGEFYQMQKQAEFDRSLAPTYRAMFFKKSYRQRNLLACGFAFLGQSTAVLVINNYGPTLYGALGYGTVDQLKLQCGWITIGNFANLFGAVIIDRVGRRLLMLGGIFGCCLCLIIEAAIVANFASPVPTTPNLSALRAGVAMLYLFLLCYGCGVDVGGVVFYSEVFPNHIRARGVAMAICVTSLADLIYLQVAATAFANIGWKFFLVFIIISGLGGIVAFFVIPETKGLPLEEISAIFGDTDEVVVYSEDIHVDHQTHDLVVDVHTGKTVGDPGGEPIRKVATEAPGDQGDNKMEAAHVEGSELITSSTEKDT